MKYEIKIAHPNDIKWRVVDRFSHESEMIEHLASPTFDYFDGMLVSVTKGKQTIFIGVYSDGRCVDISSNSDFMNGIRSKLLRGDRIKSPNPKDGFVDAWNSKTQATWMFYIAKDHLPKELVFHTAAECAEYALRDVPTAQAEIFSALELFHAWIDGRVDDKNRVRAEAIAKSVWIRMARVRDATGNDYTSMSTRESKAAYSAVMAIHADLRVEEIAVRLAEECFSDAPIAYIVHRRFPLLDVLQGLLR